MSKILTCLFLFLSVFVINSNGQTNAKDNGTLKFRELKTHKKVDYVATISRKDDTEQRKIIINTMTDTNLIPGNYRLFVNLVPEYKMSITIDSNSILEIQLPRQGQVKVTNSKKGILKFFALRDFETIEPEFKTIIQDENTCTLKLSEGRYKVSREIENSTILEEFFIVTADSETAISFD